MKTTISSYQFFNCLLIDRQFDMGMSRAAQTIRGLQPKRYGKIEMIVVGRY